MLLVVWRAVQRTAASCSPSLPLGVRHQSVPVFCSSVPLPRTFLLFAFLCSDQAQPPLPPPPTITVVCCVLVSGLVGFCLVPLFSSGSEKHQAFHPGLGAFQPKPMQSWRSGGLHTQWQAHNSIRSQVLMGRQNLSSSTGIDRPKCTRRQMFMEGALPGPRQGPASPVVTPPPSLGLQECGLSTSTSHGQKSLQ